MRKAIFAAIAVAAVALPVFASVESGLKPGDRVTPFHPEHVVGPLAGTKNCFPCTFQSRPAVQVWVHGDSQENVASIVKCLKQNMEDHKAKEFKAMVVMVADSASQKEDMKSMIADHCKEMGKDGVAIAVIDRDNEALKAYKINLDPSVKNTMIVYKDWKVAKTLVNVKMSDEKACGESCGAIALVTK
ncbi:MAG: hypothetical protein JNM34_05980 [Chthonomonadaceae bacterium]|nr:hypothetical protein [Chthonomonadaceae bacterium]